jgi:Putative adhesin
MISIRMALGAALLAVSALSATGCNTNIQASSSSNDYTITDPVTSVRVDNPVGGTQIEGTDATTVSVTEQLSYTGNPPQTSHTTTDGRLTLSYTCPSGVVSVGVNICSVTYAVKVPRGVAVQIDDQTGTATLTGLAGQLTVTSSTGSINATGLTSPTVRADTSTGAITLGFAAPPTTVDARTQVGSVTVRVPADAAYAVDASSQVGSAKVTVQQQSGSPHRITAQSQVGSVTVTND